MLQVSEDLQNVNWEHPPFDFHAKAKGNVIYNKVSIGSNWINYTALFEKRGKQSFPHQKLNE